MQKIIYKYNGYFYLQWIKTEFWTKRISYEMFLWKNNINEINSWKIDLNKYSIDILTFHKAFDTEDNFSDKEINNYYKDKNQVYYFYPLPSTFLWSRVGISKTNFALVY